MTPGGQGRKESVKRGAERREPAELLHERELSPGIGRYGLRFLRNPREADRDGKFHVDEVGGRVTRVRQQKKFTRSRRGHG